MKRLALAGLAVGLLSFSIPQTANAQGYWDGYWPYNYGAGVRVNPYYSPYANPYRSFYRSNPYSYYGNPYWGYRRPSTTERIIRGVLRSILW